MREKSVKITFNCSIWTEESDLISFINSPNIRVIDMHFVKNLDEKPGWAVFREFWFMLETPDDVIVSYNAYKTEWVDKVKKSWEKEFLKLI